MIGIETEVLQGDMDAEEGMAEKQPQEEGMRVHPMPLPMLSCSELKLTRQLTPAMSFRDQNTYMLERNYRR